LSPAAAFTPAARLRIEQPAKVTAVGKYGMATGTFTTERGAVVVKLGKAPTTVELSAK
jgi:hypothetical protein